VPRLIYVDQVCLGATEQEAAAGIQFLFLLLFPYALLSYTTIYIYILLIRHNNARPMPQGNIAMAKVGRLRCPLMCPQGVRQRNRTNLLTSRQSLNLILIVLISGGSRTLAYVIYPAMQKHTRYQTDKQCQI
jgi:hypothetical protein